MNRDTLYSNQYIGAANRKNILAKHKQRHKQLISNEANDDDNSINCDYHQSKNELKLNRQENPNQNKRKRKEKEEEEEREREKVGNIRYWHYKQTGIKSRRVKLLKHPIEHLERKIILSYILGFLFKLIAILTGPLIVLSVYLLLLPSIILRRLIWFLLNLSFVCDAKIQTNSDPDNDDDDDDDSDWIYSPLTYLETYWFKESQVNTIILVLNTKKDSFTIEKLRSLIREQILERKEFKRFCCKIEAHGIPFYKSYYWKYLSLSKKRKEYQDENRVGSEKEDEEIDKSKGKTKSKSNIKVTKDQSSSSCSSSSFISSDSIEGQVRVSIAVEQNGQGTKTTTTTTRTQKRYIEEKSKGIRVSDHIYADREFQFHGSMGSSIRRHVHKLTSRPLDMNRPLWEIRVIERGTEIETETETDIDIENNNENQVKLNEEEARKGKVYLLVRCHQSLADGKSLLSILRDRLTREEEAKETKDNNNNNENEYKLGDEEVNEFERSQQIGIDKSNDEILVNELENGEEEKLDRVREEIEEKRLEAIGDKRSFVEKVSESSSFRSSILVGPLTVLLWLLWSFTRRKNNHLNRGYRGSSRESDALIGSKQRETGQVLGKGTNRKNSYDNGKRFHWNHYDLTKFHQIKQMTRSTVSDVILCALSGALRDYLRNFNCINNPPNLNVTLTVDMSRERERKRQQQQQQQHELDDITIREKMNEFQVCKSPRVNLTVLNVPIPTSVEGQVPRLWDLRSTMDELRHSADPWVMLGLKRILFQLLPSSWYQWTINRLTLRNSSIFVSNFRGPRNVVESWCVNLFQRAILEAQQPPKIYEEEEEEELPTKDEPYSFNVNLGLGKEMDGNGSRENSNCNGNGNRNGNENENGIEIGIRDLIEKESSEKRRIQSKVENSNARRNSNAHYNTTKAKAISFNVKLDRLKKSIDLDTEAQRSEILGQMGSILAIYYCMQPPTSDIPISFNCITYHNKLFVTSISHSLLVENSAILIELFFRQLNQMANSIAKRRSLVAIVRHPPRVSIENVTTSEQTGTTTTTSEQPEDTSSDYEKQANSVMIDKESNSVGLDLEGGQRRMKDEPELGMSRREEEDRMRWPQMVKHKSSELGLNRILKCNACGCSECSCKRRKSLFSADSETRSNLINYPLGSAVSTKGTKSNAEGSRVLSSSSSRFQRTLRGAHWPEEPTKRSLDSMERQQQSYKQQQIECLCGQRLLEELDESSNVGGLADGDPCDNDANSSRNVAFGYENKGSKSSSSHLSGPVSLRSRSIDDNRPTAVVYTSSNNNVGLFQRKYLSQVSAANITNTQTTTSANITATTSRGQRFNCPKCRALETNERSPSSSINASGSDISNKSVSFSQQQQHQGTATGQQFIGASSNYNRLTFTCTQARNDALLAANRVNASSFDIGPGTITQLQVPHDIRIGRRQMNDDDQELDACYHTKTNVKAHSRSESDLIPTNRIANSATCTTSRHLLKGGQRDHSWFNLGRRVNKSRQDKGSSIRRESSNDSSNSQLSNAARSHYEASSFEAVRRNKIDPVRRRQSIAAITGLSSTHGSIVIKDETNADVSLRYQFNAPLKAKRHRRFSSVVGNVIVQHNKRRGSLIPFGLLPSQSIPKSTFPDDVEADL